MLALDQQLCVCGGGGGGSYGGVGGGGGGGEVLTLQAADCMQQVLYTTSRAKEGKSFNCFRENSQLVGFQKAKF